MVRNMVDRGPKRFRYWAHSAPQDPLARKLPFLLRGPPNQIGRSISKSPESIKRAIKCKHKVATKEKSYKAFCLCGVVEITAEDVLCVV